jgi:hypothetical protein
MDLIDRLRDLAARIPKLQQDNLVKTEEGTKNALVMPFINALGYDVFNPMEVTPELVADVGTKKGEKVDYAIMRDGKPIILFECKGFGVDLNKVHESQLFRYFSVTPARFGILTNGVQYRFYSDLTSPNKMDEAPFFSFDLASFTDVHVETLKRFTKSAFDETSNINVASGLKYRSGIRSYIETLFGEPSDSFVRFVVKESKVYESIVTQSVVAEFTGIIRESIRAYISDQVDRRLKTALASAEAEAQPPTTETEPTPSPDIPEENKIVTTQEEIDAYFAIKSIVREIIDVKRVTMKDAQSYCAVLIDNNKFQSLCRFYFNKSKKYLGIMTPEKTEEKIAISNVDDIYQYADRLKATAQYYSNRTKE